ncbi:MAG: hypothetical protein WAO61_09770 [Solirubrobacterales bacterium]
MQDPGWGQEGSEAGCIVACVDPSRRSPLFYRAMPIVGALSIVVGVLDTAGHNAGAVQFDFFYGDVSAAHAFGGGGTGPAPLPVARAALHAGSASAGIPHS